MDECPISTYQNITECLSCGTCFTCISNKYCLACQPPYFLNSQTHECTTQCPYAYYGDENTLTCMKCNPLCTKCTNGLTCTECIDGYTLDATGKCSQILCNDGFYQELKPKTQCLPCHKTCKKCVGPLRNQCVDCAFGFFYKPIPDSVYYYCVSCEEINPGYFTTSEGKCKGIFDNFILNKEKCGDGLNLGLYECDDGNRMDGDGCDRNCKIEKGFECETNDKLTDICKDTIRPEATMTVTKGNSLVLKFSELVYLNKPCIFNHFLGINIESNGIDKIDKNKN